MYQLAAIYVIVGLLIAIIAAKHSDKNDLFTAALIGVFWLPVAVYVAITGKKFDENN